MKELHGIVSAKYSIKVNSMEPYMDGHIIKTLQGKKYLQSHNISPERILFVHFAKEHLYNNNFKCLSKYLLTNEGEPSFQFNGFHYSLTDFYEGRECDFNCMDDTVKAVRQLAFMHKASKGFTPAKSIFVQDGLGALPVMLKKRLKEIKRLKNQAVKGRSNFDYLFLVYADRFYKMGEEALDRLEGKTYDLCVENTLKEKSFCHHDYDHRNVLFNNEKVFIKGFEKCCIDVKMFDLAEVIRRRMEKSSWKYDESVYIIKEYCGIENIDINDASLLVSLLQFPFRFWKICNRYYNNKKSWAKKTYIPKLENVSAMTDSHIQFIDRFKKEYRELSY